MIEKIYLQYAEYMNDISITELELSEKKRGLEEIKNELIETKDGSIGLDLTAHAYTNISDRLASIASDNSVIYMDIFNPTNPSRAILWPSNLRSFIISMIANAKSKNNYENKPSKNNNGELEYKYDIEIKKWSGDKGNLIFTAIVERNMVKTGYFNWVDKGKK